MGSWICAEVSIQAGSIEWTEPRQAEDLQAERRIGNKKKNVASPRIIGDVAGAAGNVFPVIGALARAMAPASPSEDEGSEMPVNRSNPKALIVNWIISDSVTTNENPRGAGFMRV
jgi:hypothetical protein